MGLGVCPSKPLDLKCKRVLARNETWTRRSWRSADAPGGAWRRTTEETFSVRPRKHRGPGNRQAVPSQGLDMLGSDKESAPPIDQGAHRSQCSETEASVFLLRVLCISVGFSSPPLFRAWQARAGTPWSRWLGRLQGPGPHISSRGSCGGRPRPGRTGHVPVIRDPLPEDRWGE